MYQKNHSKPPNRRSGATDNYPKQEQLLQQPMLKHFNITEQINQYIRQQRLEQMIGNKKADPIRQDRKSALNNTPNQTRKGAIQYATV